MSGTVSPKADSHLIFTLPTKQCGWELQNVEQEQIQSLLLLRPPDFNNVDGLAPKSISKRNVPTFMNCIGVGHPCLTYDVTVSKAFLRRHKLSVDKWYEFDSERLNILHEALTGEGGVMMSPGGHTLTIGRIIQWLVSEPNSVVYLGARCMDKYGDLLQGSCTNTDICYCNYQMQNGVTGIHLTLHWNNKRCEIYFKGKHPDFAKICIVDTPLVTKILERANIFYITDTSVYMLGENIRKIAYFCSSRFKIFCLVLTNEYNVETSKDMILKILQYSDIVFIGKEVARSMLDLYHIQIKCKKCKSFKSKAFILNDWIKQRSVKNCTVITTDGLCKAYVASGGNSMEATREEVFYSKYTSTGHNLYEKNGVLGFVGGFMAMMLLGHSMELNIECGFFMGRMIAGKYNLYFTPGDGQRYQKWRLSMEEATTDPHRIHLPFTIFKSSWKQ